MMSTSPPSPQAVIVEQVLTSLQIKEALTKIK
jgi:hypothetical protein